jgi:hypothetical protein
MTEQIENLLASVNEERRLAKEERATGASDVSLQSVASLLRRADTLAASGQSDNAQDLLDAAARQVSDSWSFTSMLGVEVLEFVRAGEPRTSNQSR